MYSYTHLVLNHVVVYFVAGVDILECYICASCSVNAPTCKNDNFRKFGARCAKNYRIFREITRALSIQKSSEFSKNEHARYTLERYER
jgi:hypothetical protein